MKVIVLKGLVVISFIFTHFLLKAGEITDSTVVKVNDIIIVGNKKTNEKVILRELLFKEGDTIRQADLDFFVSRSKDNLVNTSLFNFITFNVIREAPHVAQVFIMVEERWYVWPYIIFEQADRNLSAFLYNQQWNRINYGLMLVKNNFRGRRETIKLKARFGYNEQIQIGYIIPYLGGSKKHGISAEYSWNRTHEVAYYLKNDQLLYYQNPDQNVQKYQTALFEYKYRPKHYFDHNINLGYTYKRVMDTVVSMNPEFYGQGHNYLRYLSLGYTFTYDTRNYKFYPLKGQNMSLTVGRVGLGLLPDETDGHWVAGGEFYKYFDFSNRWYAGFGGRGKITAPQQQPFALESALGYADFLRSFEYYVINGQHFVTGRSFAKFAIVPEKVVYIEKWKWEKFNKIHYSVYMNAFIDAGYVVNNNPMPDNYFPNTVLYSGGLGIDFVSYYDQIFRFEFSISQQGRTGFYVHVGKAF